MILSYLLAFCSSIKLQELEGGIAKHSISVNGRQGETLLFEE